MIGTLLGFAVTIWNGLGKDWIDLWDIFDAGEEDGSVSFLGFYRHCQKIRRIIRSDDQPGDIVKKLIQGLGERQETSRLPFRLDSSEAHTLERLGVSTLSIEAIPEVFRKWQAAGTIWSFIGGSIEGLDRQAHRSPASQIEALLGVFNWPTGFQEIEQRLALAYGLLSLTQTRIVPDDLTLDGLFRIKINETGDGGNIALQPELMIRESVWRSPRGLIVAFHEIGHLVLHSRWAAELALMQYVADSATKTNARLGGYIENVIYESAKRLSAFCSAMENAADDFAISTLFPESVIEIMRSAFATERGMRIGDAHQVIRVLLGFPDILSAVASGYDQYDKRFCDLVEDRFGLLDPYRQTLLVPRNEIRAAGHELSRQRVDRILERLWEEIWEAMSHASWGKINSRIQRKALLFSYDGIRCHTVVA